MIQNRKKSWESQGTQVAHKNLPIKHVNAKIQNI
jgi:hypothetical protein